MTIFFYKGLTRNQEIRNTPVLVLTNIWRLAQDRENQQGGLKIRVKEIDQNELMRKKQKKGYISMNYVDHFLILAPTVTGCILISAFASLVGIPIEITGFAIGLKICAITAGIKKYKSRIKKKRSMIK